MIANGRTLRLDTIVVLVKDICYVDAPHEIILPKGTVGTVVYTWGPESVDVRFDLGYQVDRIYSVFPGEVE
jgi:hypothetical protein